MWQFDHPAITQLLQIILLRHQQKKACILVGLTGAQGSGKTTLARHLQVKLEQHALHCVAFSIDDLYLTHSDRKQLAQKVHPLLATRGVPGTHDLSLGFKTLAALSAAHFGTETLIPAFDKLIDDRKPKAAWPVFSGSVDIIILEGWCVGAVPQPNEQLKQAINELECLEDADGQWRYYVNQRLKDDYSRFFRQIDVLFMLKVPNMDSVFRWRYQQEQMLAQSSIGVQSVTTDIRNSSTMSKIQLRRFIQHFERLTCWMLEEMPERADLVLALDEQHNIERYDCNSK